MRASYPRASPVGEVARSLVLALIEGLSDGERLVHRYDSAVAAFEAGEPVTPDPSELLGQGAGNIVRFIVGGG